MEAEAFIHTFKVADEYFFYDVNKNNILQIDKELYNFLSENGEIKKYNYITMKIEKLKARGYLSNRRIQKIEHPMSKLIESYLTTKLQSICLQVTQNCNLRCQYCVYSGGYKNRIHSNKTMSIKTAIKAVDFLIKNSSESDSVCIGFYGGEPLLNFDLIQKTVKYATQNYPGKDYLFALTTNGTVLNEEILNFLEEFRFALTISLDGNKETHDINRKFAGSEVGSFDTIIKNVKNIKSNYKELSSKLMFSVVLSVASDFMGCNEFFTDTSCLKDTSLAVSSVSNRYNENKKSDQKEINIIAERYEIFKCILILIGKLDEDSCSNMVKNYYHKIREHYKLFYITEKQVESVAHPAGPCIPGAFRLFISADGNFYPCEKVSEISKISNIGNLNEGFDFCNVNTILNVGKLGDGMCKSCWAYRYCKLCISAIDDLTELSLEKKKKCCEKIKKEVEMMMQEYCFVSKYNFLEDD